MTDFPNLNMSIGEYYKMLVDGKRPTRQRAHETPKVSSNPSRSGPQTLKLKKPEKKEETKESKPHQPANVRHKDPDERKREEKLLNKIKAKENQKDIKSIKEHSKTVPEEKIQPKSDLHTKEKPKPKQDPPPPSEQSKLRHHPETLAPKKEQKELEQRQKQIQPLQQQHEENEMFESVFPHPQQFNHIYQYSCRFSEDRFCGKYNEDGRHLVGKITSFDEDTQAFTVSDLNKQQIVRTLSLSEIIRDSQLHQIEFEILSKPFLCKISNLSVHSNPNLYKAITAYFSQSKAPITQTQINKIATSKLLIPIVQKLTLNQGSNNEENKSDNPHKMPTSLLFRTLIPVPPIRASDQNEEMKGNEEDDDSIVHDANIEYEIIDLIFKEGFNPYKDLKTYDSEKLQEESNRAQFLTPLPAASQTLGLKFFHSLDKICVDSFNIYKSYMNKTQNIKLTKENMHDLLLSLCRYETVNKEQQLEVGAPVDQSASKQNGKQRQGVLLRIKYDPHYQDYLLMFRVTLSKQFQKERIEWIQLSKNSIRSDLSKGYLSIEFLQNLENTSATNQKIKVKNLQYVSYIEVQAAKENLKDSTLSDHYPMDSSENKATTLKTIKARCDCCNYTTEDIPSLQCSNCNKVYHEQCLQSEHLSLLSVREKKWRCSDCIRCTNCLSIKNKNLMMICTKCNSPFHYDCLDQTVKLSVPFIGLQDKEPAQIVAQTSLQVAPTVSSTQALPNVLALSLNKSSSPIKVAAPPLTENHYKCENCIYCEHCGVREAGKNRLNKWSKDFKLCSKCNKKKKNKQYCPICEMFWPNQEKEHKRENWNLNQTQQKQISQDESIKTEKPSQQEQMMYCAHCQMWIHNECDRMLQSDQIREKFANSNNNELALQNTNLYSSFPQKGSTNALEYNCADCRQQKRTQLVVQLVDSICGEDKYQFFQEPVEDRVKGYTKIVKTPMCFKYVKQQIYKLYLRNPEQLQADIALIFSNAKLFNLPKHKVHKDAIKLDMVSQQLIQSIWPTLQKYKLKTLDEDLHKQYVKICSQEQKLLRQKSLVGQDEESKVEIEMDESKFNFKAQDLFDINEHQLLSSNKVGYSNSTVGQFGMNEILFEEQREGSENQVEEDSQDGGDTFFGQQNNACDQSHAGGNAPGVVKNLRTRKQINYNEDRFLHASSDLSLVGSKRHLKVQRSLNIGQGDEENTFSLPQGQVGRPSKRQKMNQDPDFIPSQYLSSLKSQGSDLLQQAIQQQQKQQQQQNQQEQTSLALVGQDSFTVNNKQMETSQNQHIQQQQQMMMNYYQEIDDEKCYYSNPSRCSFDDPALLFEEMCYLCGSFGNREDFLSCTLCGESFHTYCLSLPHDDISKFQSYWKCLNCKFCEICSSAVQENLLLYCDVCDKAFHSYCLKPKLEVIPNCGWKCQECFNCVKCSAKSFFNADDVEQQKNKEVKDFKFSNNFSFCYQCGSNEYKKSFCSICKEKDENAQEEEFSTKIMTKRQKMQQQQQLLASEANAAKISCDSKGLSKKAGNNRDLMMKCSVCQFYSHLRCSRVTQDMIEELEQETLEGGEQKKNCYKCLNCLLSGKTINHLIRESCEHYENIHQIISRQKLLAQICAEVLNKYIPIQEKAPLFIKNFVDQNQDFFKSNQTINEWLLLLETNVCFESDESQFEQTKDQSQPIKDQEMGEEGEENKVGDELKQKKKELWERIAQRGINDLDSEIGQYEKGLLDSDKIQILFRSLKDIIRFDMQKDGEAMEIDSEMSDHPQCINKLIDQYHESKKNITENDINHAPVFINTHKVKQITYKKWDDVTFDDVSCQKPQSLALEEAKDPSEQVVQQKREIIAKSKQDIVEHELFAHKQTFLPPKRNLYKSLFYGDLYRQSQRDHFMDPSELKNLITIPNEENLELYAGIQARAEDYVKLEFKAVMQIRMQFFKWSEELIKSIVKNNQKFMRKERRKLGLKLGKAQENNSMRNEESHMTFDNGEIMDASHNKSQITLMNQAELFCNKTDDQVKNPQMKLTCILCKLSGELKVTGRLIPYQVNQFVHINCALWSTDVFETEDGQLVNFYFVHLQRAKSSKCQVCGDYGATVYCFSRKCHNSYHFPCAYRQNKVAFLKNKETFCEACCKQKELQAGYLEEYSTQRRLYIVKNIQPYLTTAFSNLPVGQISNNSQSAAQQQQANLATGSTMGAIVGAQEGDKPFQIEKWRPFYYDMFNRVGNLTVLSLKKEINQIIEDIKASFTPSQSSLIMESSSMNDFATIRIYWKFYKDQQMQIEDPAAMNPISLTKGFFLYSNNQVREIAKNEFYTVLQHVSERVKDKVQWAINMSGGGAYQTDELGRNEGNNGIYGGASVIHNQTNFWSKILAHFQKERPNFSLQNIEFSIQEFAGKTKYPISIWNRAEVKNKNFFLKSGLQSLAALCQDNKDSTFPVNQNSKASRQGGLTQDDIFKNMLKINQVGGVDNQTLLSGGSQYKRYICSKHMKYDQILQQLGKKVLFFKAPSDEQSLKQQKEKDQLQKRLNKKLRITDTIDVNKQIDLPIAMKYRMCKAQPKRVEVGPSKIHRNGLFTLEDLMAGDIVIEYVGEKIRNKVADKREVVYEQNGVGDCYLFRLDKETIIDATFFGNKARYLNHCCDANCSAKIINVQGLKHIIISANRAIKSGEELTYNYNFDIEAEKLECYCGVPNCVGRLN